MLKLLRITFRIFTQFRTYKPQKVTISILVRWLKQFPIKMYSQLIKLINQIVYISEKDEKQYLMNLNSELLNRLCDENVTPNQIIYMQIDDAGSSSPVVLNSLRNAANLTRKGSILIDSRDSKKLFKKTTEINRGAIIYVDDFSGSGKQFRNNHKWVSDFIRGTFSEFFIAPCICEEAYHSIKEIGVEPVCSILHLKKDRPLHKDSSNDFDLDKEMIIKMSQKIHPRYPLGSDNLGSMVIFYSNSPNTTPLILRGNLRQEPYFGIFPRFDDLPV